MKKGPVVKRVFSLLLSLVLLCTLASGCAKTGSSAAPSAEPAVQAKKPLRLCADFGVGKPFNPSGHNAALKRFLISVAEKTGVEDVEIEILPKDGTERQTAINRIRVELMSGEGPDLFFCNCLAPGDDPQAQALFQFPEKAMKSGVFLNLDEHISRARFMEWDKLTPAVMNAGRTEEGQFLLPLAFSFPLSVFRASDVSPYPADTTWAQVAAGDDPVLSTSMGPLLSSLFPMPEGDMIDYFSFTWKELAEYETDSLLFSESELLQRAKEALALDKAGAELSIPHFRGVMDRYLFLSDDTFDSTFQEVRQGITSKDSLTMVPLYCDQGGAVAAVKAFAGINAHTKRAEDAFAVLDVLLSETTAIYSPLYEIWTYDAMPVQAEVTFSKSEHAFSAYQDARAQITSARFPTPLDSLLSDALFQYEMLGNEATETDLAEIAAETYREMKRTLDES